MKRNKETKASIIRELTLELLKDGKIHPAKEIVDIAVKRKVVSATNVEPVYNILFHMKRKGMIMAGPEKAQYVLENVGDGIKTSEKQDLIRMEKAKSISVINLNSDDYTLLKPLPAKYNRMIFTVKENGEMKMNSTLMNKIKEREIEIFISKDSRTIVLNPLGSYTHKFTKAGTAKNKEIVSVLKRLRLKFPICYVVDWNESIGAWEGKMDISDKI